MVEQAKGTHVNAPQSPDEGSTPISPLQLLVKEIDRQTAKEFVAKNHYAITMPALTKVCYGGFIGEELVAVASWGWGTRPLHTIRKLFPSLTSADYLELGRLCILDSMPRNSESRFLSICAKELRRKMPDLKLLFSWADGFRGKPGYVYQGSNWLYGGFITTDAYVSQEGEIIHPRRYQNKLGVGKSDGLKCGRRPTMEQVSASGWRHIFGKQFRYCFFLCDRTTKESLLAESSFDWTLPYPKVEQLAWLERTSSGKAEVPKPLIVSLASFGVAGKSEEPSCA